MNANERLILQLGQSNLVFTKGKKHTDWVKREWEVKWRELTQTSLSRSLVEKTDVKGECRMGRREYLNLGMNTQICF